MNPPSLDLYFIVFLMPVTAALVTFQVNPYHALVLRGILGAISTLVYAVLGAPDVALTDALVGTLLAITLYAVAVRSSLVLRLGVLESAQCDRLALLEEWRAVLQQHYLRLEIVPYENGPALARALQEKEIHGSIWPQEGSDGELVPYRAEIRVRRIYELASAELTSGKTALNYVDVSEMSASQLKESLS